MSVAGRHTSVTNRQRYVPAGNRMYVYGNVVPKQEPVQEPRRQAHERPRRKESPQVQRNRRRAMGMNPGYVVFLSIAAAW